MNTTSRQLYSFLSGCAGNWRNAAFIAGIGQDDSSGYLLSTDRDGRPVVMAADHFRELTGEQIDPAECCGRITVDGFKALFGQYLLWHLPSDSGNPLAQLCQT